jgi:hypothetical protein
MRYKRIATVVVWASCSALLSSGIVYLGANTDTYQAQWPLAGLTGGVVGGAGAMMALWLCGDRRGMLLIGLLFAVLQAIISAKVLWGLK